MSRYRAGRWVAKSAAFTLAVGLSASGQGGPLSLSDTPLFLADAVEPNVFFLVDDSGSMEWEVLIQDGGSSGLGSGVLGGSYVLPSLNNGRDQGWLPSYPFVVSDENSIGQGAWRTKSSSFNVLYYDPAHTYEPWEGTDASGAAMYLDADPSAALVDPTNAGEGTLDLTINHTFNNWRFDTGAWYSETIFPAKYYIWQDTDNDGVVDAGDTGVEVNIVPGTPTYPRGPNRHDCGAPTTCTYAEEIQNFANWYTYYRKRNYVARAAVGSVIDGSNSIRSGLHAYNDGLRQSILSLGTSANKETLLTSLYDTEFTCDPGVCPGTPARRAMATLGEYFRGNSSPILPASQGGKCQQNFNIVVTDGYWNGTLTDAQEGMIGNDDGDDNTAFDGGDYADNLDETLADIAMFYYETDLDTTLPNEVPVIGGVDEANHQHLVTYGVAFGVAGTLDPFDTRTPGVASDTDPSDVNFSWANVASGTITTVDDLWHAAYNGRGEFLQASNPAELNESLGRVIQNIADRTSSSTSAALSSGYLGAGSLVFQARFQNANWSGQLLAYDLIPTGPNAGDINDLQWDAACKLTGGDCETTGTTEAGQNWHSGREILTYKPSTGTGVAFRWPSDPASPSSSQLDVAQTDALKRDPDTGLTDTNAVGQQRLQFIRGRRSFNDMRTRNNVLGDIINSNPQYVGAPSAGYYDGLEAQPYSSFASSNQNRTPMVYVGANDGMLHGFTATMGAGGGVERIAYVPSEVFENLATLTSQSYGGNLGHRAFVDSTPNVRDVFFNNSWKTVLVGGLGRGGQGIYALDVTNPATGNFQEGNASSLVLWEFTDDDDADLGYTYGQPAIVRLENGTWAALFGSGYNNTSTTTNIGADTSFSTTGNAVVYLIDISDGSIIRKFDTGVGTAEDPTGAARPNGLGTLSPVDVDGDFIVDFVYAADLFGNVWKIDLSGTTASSWDFAYRLGGSPQPFFVAKDPSGDPQPITTRVDVGVHPVSGGQVIFFGTGKYLETGDNEAAGQQTQTFYSVWDRNESSTGLSVIERSHLLQQSIIEELGYDASTEVRITTDTPISWHLTSGLPSSGGGKLGWYMDLYNTEDGNTDNRGERVIFESLLRDGKIVFVTMQPLPNPCDFGGESWIMDLDAYSGARLPLPPVDINGDGVFDMDDTVSTANGGDNTVASGTKNGDRGIIVRPSSLIHGDRGIRYTTGTNTSGDGSDDQSGIETDDEFRSNRSYGRQSWREIFID